MNRRDDSFANPVRSLWGSSLTRRRWAASTALAVVSAAFIGTVMGDANDDAKARGLPEKTQCSEQWGDKTGADRAALGKQFVSKQTYPVAPGGRLTVDADRGKIELITSDEDQVTVEVIRTIGTKFVAQAEEILKHHEVRCTPRGSDLVVQARTRPLDPSDIKIDGASIDLTEDIKRVLKQALNRRLRSIHFRITVPQNYNVDIKTGGGCIAIADLTGNVRCRTSGGKLQLGKINGTVHAKTSGGGISLAGCSRNAELWTSGGSITAGDIQGPAIAHTSGGSIRLGNVSGTVSARTSGGSIHVKNATGTIEAVTAGGSVFATLSKQPQGDCLFATSGGSVHVALAPSLALDVVANGRHGGVSGPFINSSKKRTSNVVKAALNGGGPTLTARTSAGSIRFSYVDAQATNAARRSARRYRAR